MAVINIKDFLQKAVGETREFKVERLGASIEIQAINELENDRLKKASTITRRSKGGNVVKDLDTNKYGDALITRCVVNPDLNDSELQGYFETEGDPIGTLKAMLLAGEYADLTAEILNLNGFNENDEEIVEDVKK